jgi:cell division protein FtsI (penicillin-binding protein 3)
MTALQQGLVQPDSVIDTHPYMLDGHRIRDVGYYPELTMTGILQKSSDTGVSRLSLAMPIQRLLDTYKNFGFGTNTGLGLTGKARACCHSVNSGASSTGLPSRSAMG